MEVLALAVCAALIALAYQAGRLRERVEIREEVNDILGPVRTDVDNLHDRFDHWTKRERRRNYVAKTEAETDDDASGLMADPAVRRAQLRLKVKRNGLLQKVQETS